MTAAFQKCSEIFMLNIYWWSGGGEILKIIWPTLPLFVSVCGLSLYLWPYMSMCLCDVFLWVVVNPSLNCCSYSWAWLTSVAAAPSTHSGPSVCSEGCQASAECQCAGAGLRLGRRWGGQGCSQLSGSAGWSFLLHGDTALSPGWRRRRRRRPASSADWAAVDVCPPPTANRPIRQREGEEVKEWKLTLCILFFYSYN